MIEARRRGRLRIAKLVVCIFIVHMGKCICTRDIRVCDIQSELPHDARSCIWVGFFVFVARPVRPSKSAPTKRKRTKHPPHAKLPTGCL